MKWTLMLVVVNAVLMAGTEPPVSARIGRPVQVVSISFFPGKYLEQIRAVVEKEAAKGSDLVVLPEKWLSKDRPETLDGPTITTMKELARKYRTYIVCPIDRKEGSKRFNTAVLIDREGKVVLLYDKIYPYWAEFKLSPPASLGDSAPVFQTDFGRLGIAICFDVNFPAVWQQLADRGAELVVWPSAYSAGMSLQAHAINHHYYIVSSTLQADCTAYDITGEQLLHQTGKDINISRLTLDLDRGIYHQNFNLAGRDKLLHERGADIVQEKWLPLEQWFVLKSKRPGVSARETARQYGLEELPHYIERSRLSLDRIENRNYAARVAQETPVGQR